jgi:hypothetical protein
MSSVEFISFNGLDHPAAWGRAYGEFKLLDYAIDHSDTLKTFKDCLIWKVTGRYRVLNISDLIRTAPANFDLYCDIRKRPMPWVDLRVLGCTLEGYEKLLRGICNQIRQDIIKTSPETYLYPIIMNLAKSHRIESRFAREPRIDGIRGKDSQNYLSGLNYFKYMVRSAVRRILPRFEV